MPITPRTCALNMKCPPGLKHWILGSYVLAVFEEFVEPLGYEMQPEEASHLSCDFEDYTWSLDPSQLCASFYHDVSSFLLHACQLQDFLPNIWPRRCKLKSTFSLLSNFFQIVGHNRNKTNIYAYIFEKQKVICYLRSQAAASLWEVGGQ